MGVMETARILLGPLEPAGEPGRSAGAAFGLRTLWPRSVGLEGTRPMGFMRSFDTRGPVLTRGTVLTRGAVMDGWPVMGSVRRWGEVRPVSKGPPWSWGRRSRVPVIRPRPVSHHRITFHDHRGIYRE